MLKFKKEKIDILNSDLLMMKQRGLWVIIFKYPLRLVRGTTHAVLNGFQWLRTYDTIEQAMHDLTCELCFPLSKLISLGVHFVNLYSMASTPQELRRLYNPIYLLAFVDWIKRGALRGSFPNLGIETLINMSTNRGASTGVDIT